VIALPSVVPCMPTAHRTTRLAVVLWPQSGYFRRSLGAPRASGRTGAGRPTLPSRRIAAAVKGYRRDRDNRKRAPQHSNLQAQPPLAHHTPDGATNSAGVEAAFWTAVVAVDRRLLLPERAECRTLDDTS